MSITTLMLKPSDLLLASKAGNPNLMDFVLRFTSLIWLYMAFHHPTPPPRSCAPSCSRLLIFQPEAEKSSFSLSWLFRSVTVCLYDKNSQAALCAPNIAKEERRSSVLSVGEKPRDAMLVWLVIVNWGKKREIQFDVWMPAFSLLTSSHWPVNVNIGWQPLSRSELLFLSVGRVALQFLCCYGCFS